MTDERDPVRRWSDRKLRARQSERHDKRVKDPGNVAALDVTAEPGTGPVLNADSTENLPVDQAREGPDEGTVVAEDLPDIETLDETSDFSAFLREGVPEELQRRALRKLWRLDPVLANLDGLVDYGEDFTDAALVVDNLKTAYKVGRGLVRDDEPSEEEEAPTEAAEDKIVAAPEPVEEDQEPESPERADGPEPSSAEHDSAAAPKKPEPDHA